MVLTETLRFVKELTSIVVLKGTTQGSDLYTCLKDTLVKCELE